MEIPKYIEQLIQRREKLANKLNEVSVELGDWLKKNHISLGEDYTLSGCMIYCEPSMAADAVREDIINFDKKNDING